MKYEQGELTEADIKARRRFWNKRGFFGEPEKKELERSSLKMQKLLAAMKDCTRGGDIADKKDKPVHKEISISR